MRVGDDYLYAAQAALRQALEEVGPEEPAPANAGVASSHR
jgi:hypothetical protein